MKVAVATECSRRQYVPWAQQSLNRPEVYWQKINYEFRLQCCQRYQMDVLGQGGYPPLLEPTYFLVRTWCFRVLCTFNLEWCWQWAERGFAFIGSSMDCKRWKWRFESNLWYFCRGEPPSQEDQCLQKLKKNNRKDQTKSWFWYSCLCVRRFTHRREMRPFSVQTPAPRNRTISLDLL